MEGGLDLGGDDRRRRRRLGLGGLATLAASGGEPLGDALGELGDLQGERVELGHERIDPSAQLGVLSLHGLDVDDHARTTPCSALLVDASCAGLAEPPPASGGEVEAREPRGESSAVDHHLGLVVAEGRKLEGAGFEAFGQHAPARAIKPQRPGEAAILAEKEVEMTVDRVEAEASHGAGEGVEGAAQVEGVDGDKDTDRGGPGQHARSTRTRRARDSSWKWSSSSTVEPARWTT